MEHTETDLTVLFRSLSRLTIDVIQSADTSHDKTQCIQSAFYQYATWTSDMHARWATWLDEYVALLIADGIPESDRHQQMCAVNPKYIIRNYLAQLAIDAIESGDDTMIHQLLAVLQRPFDEHPAHEDWAGLMPDWARDRAGCSALSCSS